MKNLIAVIPGTKSKQYVSAFATGTFLRLDRGSVGVRTEEGFLNLETGYETRDLYEYAEAFEDGTTITLTVGKGFELESWQNDELTDLLRNGNKINAIKKVREWTNIGLKEAKDYVDNFQASVPATSHF